MRKALIVCLLAAMLLVTLVQPASAGVWYGHKWTTAHGWVVYVDNRSNHTIRADCTWHANGSWSIHWRMRPWQYSWTTSDAGRWGDAHPRDLRCHYHTLW